MATEIRVPALGESVTEATVGKWFKQAGDAVAADEPLVELETDKVTLEVPAPAAGVLSEIVVKAGETVAVGAVLGAIASRRRQGRGAGGEGAGAGKGVEARLGRARSVAAGSRSAEAARGADCAPARAGAARGVRRCMTRCRRRPRRASCSPRSGIGVAGLHGSGRRGQVLKQDVLALASGARAEATAESSAPGVASAAAALLARAPEPKAPPSPRPPIAPEDEAREERVRMTRLRQTIAKRLKEAQDTAAMLTTFNDVDMSAVMALRREYREAFEKKHGVKLGLMGFFVKACVQALKDIPAVNAEIDGTDIVYKNYYHVGVAVGTERGLVVPVLRDADRMGLAQIEAAIADFGARAREGKLGLEEMQGGTFTISNGGIYGSLLSTPILNAPQSGILGMHRIEERAVVRDGQIVARPMMYLALSYDHRLVDGKEAVTFLVHVKDAIEDPKRLVLDL